MASDNNSAPVTQYLTFGLAGEEYAIAVLEVREILEYTVLTKVPGTPAFIRGVMNLRGSVVPVIDLALKFGLEERPITRWTCIIIIEVAHESDRTTIGILADSVSQVVDLRADDIEPPPSFGTGIRVEYLIGMGKLGRKFALILDVDKVLSPTEMMKVFSVPSQALEPAPDEAPDVSLDSAEADSPGT